jgi:hypothetical protein
MVAGQHRQLAQEFPQPYIYQPHGFALGKAEKQLLYRHKLL